jgi:hypothetical protein
VTDRLAWAKPGTKAVIQRFSNYGAGVHSGHGEIVVVLRETPAQVVVTGDRKFRKSDGKQIGGNGTLSSIDLLVGSRFGRAEIAIRNRAEEVRRGGNYRAALLDIADLVAAALADIDELEAPAIEVA